MTTISRFTETAPTLADMLTPPIPGDEQGNQNTFCPRCGAEAEVMDILPIPRDAQTRGWFMGIKAECGAEYKTTIFDNGAIQTTETRGCPRDG